MAILSILGVCFFSYVQWRASVLRRCSFGPGRRSRFFNLGRPRSRGLDFGQLPSSDLAAFSQIYWLCRAHFELAIEDAPNCMVCGLGVDNFGRESPDFEAILDQICRFGTHDRLRSYTLFGWPDTLAMGLGLVQGCFFLWAGRSSLFINTCNLALNQTPGTLELTALGREQPF
jgi:hypothetical protein